MSRISISRWGIENKRAFIIGIMAVALLVGVVMSVCALLGVGFSKSADGSGGIGGQGAEIPSFTLIIDEQAVSAEEFIYALNEVKMQAVESCSGGEDSIGAEFWRANKPSCDAETSPIPHSESERMEASLMESYSPASRDFCAAAHGPSDFAACKAIRLLERQHAAYQQAAEAGQMREGTWSEVIQSWNSTNFTNDASSDGGGIVYGLNQYELPIYLSQYLVQLRDAYVADDTAPSMNITEEQAKQYYEENSWDFSSDIDSIMQEEEKWEIIKGNVKARLRSEIYYALLSSQVQSMDTVIDQPSVVNFVKFTFGA